MDAFVIFENFFFKLHSLSSSINSSYLWNFLDFDLNCSFQNLTIYLNLNNFSEMHK
jgi:hypothetical protein